MTKSIFALFLVGILAGGQAAQEAQTKPGTGLIKKPPKAVKGLSGPVTSSEVIAVCHRVESALQRVLKLPPAPKTALKESTAPARRDPIVLEFERLYIYARPKFVVTFRPALIDRSLIDLKSTAARQAAEQLILAGCIGRAAPLVSGPGETLSARDFGETVGHFIARLAEYTHTPTSRFSPYLNGAAGN